jgi:hypothetical protein
MGALEGSREKGRRVGQAAAMAHSPAAAGIMIPFVQSRLDKLPSQPRRGLRAISAWARYPGTASKPTFAMSSAFRTPKSGQRFERRERRLGRCEGMRRDALRTWAKSFQLKSDTMVGRQVAREDQVSPGHLARARRSASSNGSNSRPLPITVMCAGSTKPAASSRARSSVVTMIVSSAQGGSRPSNARTTLRRIWRVVAGP